MGPRERNVEKGLELEEPPPPRGASLWARRVGAQWNTGCQRLIFKATHGHSSLTVKWQAWQVACTLSWDTKAWDPRDGERGDEWLPCL